MLLWLACGSGGDACGGQGSDVAICRYNSPPEVVILAPADGAQTGAEAAAEAVVADDQSEPPELLLRWSSDVDGALEESTADAEGRVAAALILSPGLHRLRLDVWDADAEEGSDEIEIEVVVP